jgi:ANTAR domain/GAF domain
VTEWNSVTRPDDRPAGRGRPASAELGRLAFAEHTLESVLGRVSELAARDLPGEPVASVTVVAGRPATVAASHELASALDAVQYRLSAGPCLSAATTGQPAVLADTRAPSDWGAFAERAAGLGCGSVLSLPLPLTDRGAGSLNVYVRGEPVDGGGALDPLVRLVEDAVVPVANLYLYRSAVERADQLEAALESRAVIDQAKGILMERFKLTADRAFGVLARVSMERNVKVREVAQQFVESGELPVA